MINSIERWRKIEQYLAQYMTQIRLANDAGLYDNAKLYELFAKEICGSWFDQKFYNLNAEKKDYACVDLLSEDGRIYVQVSTEKDINAKIKKTLNSIAKSKDPVIQAIRELFFFTLDVLDGKTVKDRVGKDKIGSIDFEAEKNLITPSKLLKRAKDDIEFQKNLFSLILKDSMQFSELEEKFKYALERSKFKILDIDGLIHGEYEIPRNDLKDRVNQENCQFIMISGEPGVGKSAFGKMFVQEQEFFLYARADELAGYDQLEDIWHVDLKNLLFLLGEKRLYFFVDALEFIADDSNNGKTNLRQLFAIVSENPNAFVITSCRTRDMNSFPDILTEYDIADYRIEKLSDNELKEISEKYSIVKSVMGIPAYQQILTTPFYLNMIISNLSDIANFQGENELRRKIWRDVICLGKNLPEGVRSTDVIATVRKIVFERAKNCFLGISEDEIDRQIAETLLSRGIIVTSDHRVRLKYDIFEDICFEVYFEDLFKKCREKYQEFFQEIEAFGPCRYRRYQIWLEHKLYEGDQKDRFLGKVLFKASVPSEWREQTIIGIVRSPYSSAFVTEYEQQLWDSGLFLKVIKNINLYAFEVGSRKLPDGEPYTSIHPIDSCRGEMIAFSQKYRLPKVRELRQSLLVLFSDYSLQKSGIQERTAHIAIEILWYYLQVLMNASGLKIIKAEEVMNILRPLYQLAKYAKETIREFWEEVIAAYLNDDHSNKHILAEKILEETVLKPSTQLATHMPKELCRLADVYWLETPQREADNKQFNLPEGGIFDYNPYALNRNARGYPNKIISPYHSIFIRTILEQNFWNGLDWGISLINTHVERYAKRFPEALEEIEIFCSDGKERKYFGNECFWSVCSRDSTIPGLFGDFIYLLKKRAEEFLKNDSVTEASRQEFAEKLKTTIFSKTNNIMLLRVVRELGVQFPKLLPGYALELAGDIRIIRWDVHCYALSQPNEMVHRLEQEIMVTAMIPFFQDRYETGFVGSLTDYILRLQLPGFFGLTDKIQGMLDHMYQRLGEDTEDRLLINRMDLRSYDVQISGNEISLIPLFGDAVAKLREKGDNWSVIGEKEFARLTNEINTACIIGELTLPFCLEKISQLKEKNYDLVFAPQISQIKIALIVFALHQEKLSIVERSKLCDYWISGILSLFAFQTFVFERRASSILFQQAEKELMPETAMKLRILILRLLTANHYNGQLQQISDILWEYLQGNKKLAESVYAAVIGLSKGNDDYQNIEECPAEAVQFFLNGKTPPNVVEQDFGECNFSRLSMVVRCGLGVKNKQFRKTIRYLLRSILRVWKGEPYCDDENIWDAEKNLKAYFSAKIREMEEAEDISDLLFDETMIGFFSEKSVRFYTDVFSWIHVLYFDSYSCRETRIWCERLISRLETYVQSVPDESLKKELTRVFFLEPWRTQPNEQRKLLTSYTFSDKQFLNRLWSRYGNDHVQEYLLVLESMKVKELLPDVLISIRDVFSRYSHNPEEFVTLLQNHDFTLNKIITLADVYYRDAIRQDDALSEAYEDLLSLLAKFNFREAAVLLDDFRVH